MKQLLTTIGIIGGFGPEATALFYTELIQECRNARLKPSATVDYVEFSGVKKIRD